MSLAFLYPLFWCGALALAAPLWLHLRRKAERSLVRFSAVQFLEDEPPARSSPLQLQNVALLLIRLLALVLFVAAFAWPYWPQERRENVAESRVYILDNTLSRQVAGAADRDRLQLLATLRDTSPDTQLAVVELTSLPRVLLDFNQPREEGIARLEALQPSFQRGSFLAAFQQANSLLAQSLGSRRSIVFLSDQQENQWLEAANVAPFLTQVDVETSDYGAAPRTNVAVLTPRVRRLYLGAKSIAECEFRVLRHGPLDSAVVTLEADGEEVGRRRLEFAPESPPITTISFQWEVEPRDRVVGQLSVEAENAEDALAADNRAFFSLPAVTPGSVVALTRSPFLRTALDPAVMQDRWTATLVDDVQNRDLSTLPRADVLLAESRFLLAPAARQLADDYLAKGRGVILLVDEVAPPVQTYLRGHGIEFRSVVDQPAGSESFRYVQFDHPIFQPFRAPDFGNLLELKVHRYRRLAAPRASALAYAQHGDLLLLEADRSHGKLLVSAFGFDRGDTNWPLHPTFVPFLDLCLQHARARPALQTDFEPGERCVWSLADDEVGRELLVRSGDRIWERQELRGNRVEFRVPVEPGAYEVSFDGGATWPHELNIHTNPAESELSFAADRAALDTWIRPTDSAAEHPVATAATLELSTMEILRQRLWWWLVLVGAGLLAVEMSWLFVQQRTV